jgi:hypothetical protein
MASNPSILMVELIGIEPTREHWIGIDCFAKAYFIVSFFGCPKIGIRNAILHEQGAFYMNAG